MIRILLPENGILDVPGATVNSTIADNGEKHFDISINAQSLFFTPLEFLGMDKLLEKQGVAIDFPVIFDFMVVIDILKKIGAEDDTAIRRLANAIPADVWLDPSPSDLFNLDGGRQLIHRCPPELDRPITISVCDDGHLDIYEDDDWDYDDEQVEQALENVEKQKKIMRDFMFGGYFYDYWVKKSIDEEIAKENKHLGKDYFEEAIYAGQLGLPNTVSIDTITSEYGARQCQAWLIRPDGSLRQPDYVYSPDDSKDFRYGQTRREFETWLQILPGELLVGYNMVVDPSGGKPTDEAPVRIEYKTYYKPEKISGYQEITLRQLRKEIQSRCEPYNFPKSDTPTIMHWLSAKEDILPLNKKN